MPRAANMTSDQKAYYFDFWTDVFEGLGFEPVALKNPTGLLLLPKDSIDERQVEDCRGIARRLSTYADRLESDLRKARVVVPESANGDSDEDDDTPIPPVLPPQATRRQMGVDPVAPRVKGRGRGGR